MSGKFALIIGNTEYADPGLAQLTAPGKDADDFARVLRVKDLCGFDDVNILLNQSSNTISEAIDKFFDRKKPDDLLVLYFSGHGVRDEYGSLYLAVKNTNRSLLRSTAIKSDFIREAMDQCRSRRQVLLLDCCNSGAFAQGTKAEIGGSVGTARAFEGSGYGRIILTASDATQFAWEGDKVIGGESTNSLFTHFLVKGLEGEADGNSDGIITVDELYDYAYGQIVNLTPKQTPGKWSYREQGNIILRQYAPEAEMKAGTDDVRRAPAKLVPQVHTQQEGLSRDRKARTSKNWGLNVGIVSVISVMALGAAWIGYRALSAPLVPPALSATSAPTLQQVPTDTSIPEIPLTGQGLDSEFLNDVEVILADDFDDPLGSGWNMNIGEIKNGIMEISGNESWDYSSRNREFGTNEGIVIDFKYSADSYTEIYLGNGVWDTDAYRRFGLYVGGNSAQLNEYSGRSDRGGTHLEGNLELNPGDTYTLLIAILPDGEFLEAIWNPSNPTEALSVRKKMDESWVEIPWTFWIGVYRGTIQFDNFKEIQFSGAK